MDLTDLRHKDLRRLAQALRDGDPVHLKLRRCPPRGVRLDEIAPLCQRVEALDPRLQRTLDASLAPGSRPDHPARVTAIIPCARGVPIGLRALLDQDVTIRVIILSNGDGPRLVPGAQVIRVPWEGHGRTRQRAIDLVDDDYVLFTVDDAMALGAGCVRTLVEQLDAGGWDAVTARQIPWPDASPVTKDRLRRWTPAGVRTVQTPQVDHVFGLYRTETLRQHPLPDVPIAEDAWWSRGRRVGYVPMAPVLHSHDRRVRELFRRELAIHRQRQAMGDAPTVGSLVGLLGALPGVVRPTLQSGPRETAHQIAELAGQWWGGRGGGARQGDPPAGGTDTSDYDRR